MQRMKNAAGRAATTATTNRQQGYRPPKSKSTKSSPRARRVGTERGNPTSLRLTWSDRAALNLLALAGNLQEAHHLTMAERQGGWTVFDRVLRRFIDAIHSSRELS